MATACTYLHQLLDLAAGNCGIVVVEACNLLAKPAEPLLGLLVGLHHRQRLLATKHRRQLLHHAGNLVLGVL